VTDEARVLTAYLDETGHARDPHARYAGMVGVIAPDEAWEVFDEIGEHSFANTK